MVSEEKSEYAIHFRVIKTRQFSKYAEESTEYYCNELLKYGEFRKRKDAFKAARKGMDRYFRNRSAWSRMFIYDIILTGRDIPIGYLWYQVEPNGLECCLMYIIIYDKWRGKGWGRQALEIYEKEAYQRGIRRSFLYVFVQNSAAHLYLKNGYMVEKQVSFHRPKVLRYRMSKRLGPG